MPTFRVFDTFKLSSMKWLVFVGDIEEGVIDAGMSILVPANSATNIAYKINSVESILRSGESFIGLTVLYEDEADAEITHALGISDEVLKVQHLEEKS